MSGARPYAAPAPAPRMATADKLLVGGLFLFYALPFLLGDQAASMTSVKESGISNTQGDSSKQLIMLALYGLAGCGLWRRVSDVAPPGLGVLLMPVLALVAWMGLSMAWADLPGVSFRRVIALSGTLTIGVYMALRWPPRELARLLCIVAVLVLGASLVVAVVLPGSGLDQEGRLRGVFAHKNMIAAFCAVALVSAYAVWEAGASWRHNRLALVAGSLSLVSLALTASASPVPAVAVAGFVMWRLQRTPDARYHQLTAPLCYLLVLGIVLLPWVAPSIGELAELFGREADFSGRTVVWAFATDFIERSPLLGYGYASFWHGPAGLLFVQYAHFPVTHAHNGMVQMLLDGGAVALVFYVTALIGAIQALHRVLNSPQRQASVWLAGLMVLYLFASQAETHLFESNDLYTALFVYTIVRTKLKYSPGRPLPPRSSHDID